MVEQKVKGILVKQKKRAREKIVTLHLFDNIALFATVKNTSLANDPATVFQTV
jgi:hypothetical protein